MNNSDIIKVISIKQDEKILAKNILIDISINNYLKVVDYENLDIQRGKITSRKSDVYQRLIEDIKGEALVPPVSLAADEELSKVLAQTNDLEQLETLLNKNIGEKRLDILDGLQRTYCFLNVLDDLQSQPKELEAFKQKRIIAELWFNISFTGLLYKMIVLNTGQVKMSMRHQIEILNKPLRQKIMQIGKEIKGAEVVFSTYKDRMPTKEIYQYNFGSIVEALTSFTTGNPIVDKTNEVVQELEKFTFVKEHISPEILQSDEEIKEFSYLLLEFDEKLFLKYKSGLKDEEGNQISWTSRNDFINSTPFLCGFFAAFGTWLKRDQSNYVERKKKFFSLFDEDSEDPLKFKDLSNILEEEKKKTKKFGDTIRRFSFNAFNYFFQGEERDLTKIWMRAASYV